ncbi:MAG: hypothetical protein QNJ13_05140 [Paracoccaceae bacterium]|nr:hypothetical protein [Paracoccaceae bacterium]
MKPVAIGAAVVVLALAAFFIGTQFEDDPDTVGEAVGEAIDDAVDAGN